MSSPKYVQHKSGQGATWQVYTEQIASWGIQHCQDWFYLPKSEYLEVPALEVWTDVTADVVERHEDGLKSDPRFTAGDFIVHDGKSLAKLMCRGEYRIRKVRGKSLNAVDWAFIIERRTEGGQP